MLQKPSHSIRRNSYLVVFYRTHVDCESEKSPMSKRSADEPFTKELGSKKQVTVRRFKEYNLVDIREFYIDKNDEKKPGKKGISLTEDLWKKLIESKDEIQEALDELKGNVKKQKRESPEEETENEVKAEDQPKLEPKKDSKIKLKPTISDSDEE